MQEHDFFKQKDLKKIKFDIVLDEEPEEGLQFQNNKIYINTKDPTLYQRFHEKAIEKLILESGQDLENKMNEVLSSESSTGMLFPRLSRDLNRMSNTSNPDKQDLSYERDEDDNLQ